MRALVPFVSLMFAAPLLAQAVPYGPWALAHSLDQRRMQPKAAASMAVAAPLSA